MLKLIKPVFFIVVVVLLTPGNMPASTSLPTKIVPTGRATDRSGVEVPDPATPVQPTATPVETCLPISSESYGTLPVVEWIPARWPAERHADLNLALRGYTPTVGTRSLIDIVGGGDDRKAPQLAGLFSPTRVPTFAALYQVHNWDWDCNCRSTPIDDVAVTMVELAVHAGEVIHVPTSGYEIGGGYQALVLYAAAERVTLKYTADDDVIVGYTLHLENICVEPNLLALYRSADRLGRHAMPALHAGQAVGRAHSDRLGVVIRDTGAFMDPRARQDWWHVTGASSP